MGLKVARRISAFSTVTAVIATTLFVRRSCTSKIASKALSKRSAQRCRPVEASTSCPVIRSRFPAFRMPPFKDVPDAKLPSDLLHINGAALVGERRVSRDHEEPLGNRDSAVMMSSTMPSAKYSCSGSPLMFLNGSTAMEGLSGSVEDFGCSLRGVASPSA